MKKLLFFLNILFSITVNSNAIELSSTEYSEVSINIDKRNSLLTSLENDKLLANDTNGVGGLGSNFGRYVSIDGNLALVGAHTVRENGVVYVFKYDGNNWNMVTFLESSDIELNDSFGCSVSLLGMKAVIGSCNSDSNGNSSGAVYVFELADDIWYEKQKLIASDSAGLDKFGTSVSLSDNRVVIGSQFNDDHGSNSGSIYVFDYNINDDLWSETQKITASNAATGDEFGKAVSISGDRILVGAALTNGIFENSGSAYIFDLINGIWTESDIFQPDLPQVEDRFGWSVSLDGDRALIGSISDRHNAVSSGAAYIFDLVGGDWIKSQALTPSDKRNGDLFGYSVSLENDRAVVGSFFGRNTLGGSPGSAFVFELPVGSSEWAETQKLSYETGVNGSRFGTSLSLSGNSIISGASNDGINGLGSGVAFIYKYTNPGWSAPKTISSPGGTKNHFANSVSLSGDVAFVGSPGTNEVGLRSGSVYVFNYNGSSWEQVQKLVASDAAHVDLFGWSVSISGNKSIIGAYAADGSVSNTGAAYIFELIGNTWLETHKLRASDESMQSFFGWSVDIFEDKAIIGAYKDGIQAQGAAYIFEFDGNDWIETPKLIPSDLDISDQFGWDVSIFGERALVSSHYDSTNNDGAVYVFDLSNGTWVESQKLTISDVGTQFGASVSLYGDRALISATNAAYIFDFFANNWSETQKLVSPDIVGSQRFGYSSSLYQERALVGAIERGPNSDGSSIGTAYVFELSGGNWVPTNKLIPSDGVIDDEFGNSVSLSEGGALIGSYLSNENGTDSGSAYFYEFVGLPTAVDDDINTIGSLFQDANETNLMVLDNDMVSSSHEILSVTQPNNAIVVNALNRVTYHPDPGYCNDGNPTDDFTYTLDGPSIANVFVTVWCKYAVGGVVYGLLPGNSITLKNTVSPISSQTMQVNSNGQFAFAPPIYTYRLNNPYSITVMTQPESPAQSCNVVNGSGVILGFDIMDIEIHCDSIFLNGFE